MQLQCHHIFLYIHAFPTLSLGMSRSSDPCFKNTLPAVCCGLIPTPSARKHTHTHALVSHARVHVYVFDISPALLLLYYNNTTYHSIDSSSIHAFITWALPFVIIALVCAGTLNCRQTHTHMWFILFLLSFSCDITTTTTTTVFP